MCLHQTIAIRLDKRMTSPLAKDIATIIAASKAMLASAVVQDMPMNVQQLLELNKLFERNINTITPSQIVNIMLDKQDIFIIPFLSMMYSTCCVPIGTTKDS